MLNELAIQALMEVAGIGPKTILSIAKAWDVNGPSELYDALRGHKATATRPRTKNEIEEAWSRSKEVAESCYKANIVMLGINNECYPQQLRTIPNPPIMLFVAGAVDALSRKGVAIIGTREPSPFGLKAAHRLAETAVQAGLIVVSGLAEGCDTAGHQGCLEAKGVTIAVLAHGHGKIYPASNKCLAQEILDSGGTLLSEYPPGSPSFRTRFVERDRLQSGIARGIIVVETDIKGGTMHTVNFAREQKRKIGIVDHPLKWREHDKTRGNQYLIHDGQGLPLANANDASSFYNLLLDDCTPATQSVEDGQMKLPKV